VQEDVKKATDMIQKIKRLLYNYDLAIVEAKGQYELRQAAMRRYSQDKRKFAVRKKLAAKIDCDRIDTYINEINSKKQEVYDNLMLVLDRYNKRYTKVFMMYFIEEKTYEEIATVTSYSRDAIRTIVRRLKNDILDIFLVE
jgi:DNA-directed RNA polymerase specialized sigma24 family protein